MLKKHSVCICFFLCVWMLLLTGCTLPIADTSYHDARVHIVTTVFPPYDFARNITAGADGVLVEQLLRPGMESHTFDPTPADILKVQNCDIFIYTGGESDAWVDVLLEAAENPDMRILRMMDCTDNVEEESVEGMTQTHDHNHAHEESEESDHAHEEEDDHDHIEYDEHVWTDPHNAVLITEAITEVLCEADSDYADLYRAGCEAYVGQLSNLDLYFRSVTENAVRDTVIFGDRFPFRYLCDAYGLSYRAAFPGCAEESEPSAATMIYLIEKVREEKIPAIFTIEMSNGKIAAAIAEETGAKILQLHSCHNRTAAETEADVSYQDLMYANAEALKQALQESD